MQEEGELLLHRQAEKINNENNHINYIQLSFSLPYCNKAVLALSNMDVLLLFSSNSRARQKPSCRSLALRSGAPGSDDQIRLLTQRIVARINFSLSLFKNCNN